MSRRSAGTIILDKLHETVLLVLGRESMKWSFPKGHVKTNEDIKEAAIRETYEETGIVLEMHQLGKRVNIRRSTYYNVIVDMREYTNIEIKDPWEILDVKWCKISDLHLLNVNMDVGDVFKFTPNIVDCVGVVMYTPTHRLFFAAHIEDNLCIPRVSIKFGQIEPHIAKKILLYYGIITSQDDLIHRIQIGNTAYYIVSVATKHIHGLTAINIDQLPTPEKGDITYIHEYIRRLNG